VDRERFERLVAQAIDGLPAEFRNRLDNVDVVVADQPASAQLAELGLKRGETLLGLYEGVPLTDRGRNYGMVVPDKITIFQKPIEAECRYDARIVTEIRKVVRHEIAHHFGISDARLEQLENDED
jgi:predicted Zn-dependent protease with MMP-like domain